MKGKHIAVKTTVIEKQKIHFYKKMRHLVIRHKTHILLYSAKISTKPFLYFLRCQHIKTVNGHFTADNFVLHNIKQRRIKFEALGRQPSGCQ